MSVSHFVSGSAVLLLGWLTLTFLSEVPTKPYSIPGSESVPVSAKSAPAEKTIANFSKSPSAPLAQQADER